MTDEISAPLSGRRAEAARNDELILAAARAVFFADTGAPIAAVAERAGVGIGALYRRYRGKEELLQHLAIEGLRRYVAEVEIALADDGDPWEVFTHFMRRCLDAGSGSVTLRFAGHFAATDELEQTGRRAHDLTVRLLDRTKSAAALRSEIEVGDLTFLFEQLQAVRIGDQHRTAELRHRYLALMLDALRVHNTASPPLPGPAPHWTEIRVRYSR